MINDLKIFINENAKIITIFLTALILFGGISLVNNQENWWIIPLGITIFAIITLLFINAKAFIKFFIALFATIILSAYAFQIGLSVSGNNSGSLWMGLMWLNFFTFMSISYAKESNQSRWTTLIVTQVLSFLYFYVLVLSISVCLGVLFGEILTIGTFILFYYFPFKNFINTKSMPEQELTKTFINRIEKEVKNIGWEMSVLEK